MRLLVCLSVIPISAELFGQLGSNLADLHIIDTRRSTSFLGGIGPWLWRVGIRKIPITRRMDLSRHAPWANGHINGRMRPLNVKLNKHLSPSMMFEARIGKNWALDVLHEPITWLRSVTIFYQWKPYIYRLSEQRSATPRHRPSGQNAV